MALSPPKRASFPATASDEVLKLHHCGFDLTVRTTRGRYGSKSYAYVVLHRGHILHESAGDFGSASAADKAARKLIDDALHIFDRSVVAEMERDEV